MPHREHFGVHIDSVKEIDGVIYRHSSELHLPEGYYVPLENKSEYEIRLSNDNDTIADADLFIDGKFINGFRLEPHSSITVQRPPQTERRFTFVGEFTQEALETGNIPGKSQNGLLEVTFRLKRKIPKYVGLGEREYMPVSASQKKSTSPRRATSPSRKESQARSATAMESRYSSGVTVLGRENHQEFITVTPIPPNEIAKTVTISLRLVVKNRRRRVVSPSRRPPRIDDIEWREDEDVEYVSPRSRKTLSPKRSNRP